MGEFTMPSLGADMEHGKVVEWLVKPGDYVHRGDVIAEVDTEKTVMEIETFEEGVVAEFLVDLGETVAVGTPIAVITTTPAEGAQHPKTSTPVEGARHPKTKAPAGAESARSMDVRPPNEPAVHVSPPVRRHARDLGVDLAKVKGTGSHGAITRHDVEAVAAGPHVPANPATTARTRATAAEAPANPATAPTVPEVSSRRVASSPRARRLAEERGVDLAAVTGSGPHGAVTAADVDRAAGTATAASQPRVSQPRPRESAPAAKERVANIHHAVGVLMSRSKREIPHYYVSTTIDMSAAVTWMQRANAGRPISKRLVPSALLLAATARAAKGVPDVNGFFIDDAFRASEAVHLGVAVALRGGGLIAPAIHDADTLTVDELMVRLRDLVSRARAGRLQRAEMTDGTLTVTNLGDLGVEAIFGVIYPPQVALVGFGRVTERPVARDGLLGVSPTVIATLSADHRASDGMVGGRLLARIDELLQKPEEL